MVKEFKNKNEWALILGGSTGLGLATAVKLAKHGMNICIIHRNLRSELDEIEKNFKIITKERVSFASYNIDAFQSDKRQKFIQNLKKELGEGKIKILVHSIAKGNLKPMVSNSKSTLEADDFRLTIQTMGISLYEWVKLIFEAKMFSNDSRVVSFTSEGNKKAWKSYAAISAAKATLEAITRNIALEFAPFGIRTNCIQAGVTDTSSFRMIPKSDKIKEYTLKRNPFKRLTTPEDIANVVYLLCKDEARWINGTIVTVDGGEHIN